LNPKQLIVEFYFGCLSLREKTASRLRFVLDRLTGVNSVMIEIDEGNVAKVYWRVYSEGRTKVLEFADDANETATGDSEREI
jgi:hypothetical protein